MNIVFDLIAFAAAFWIVSVCVFVGGWLKFARRYR